MFAAPAPRGVRRWARRYALPLALTGTFFLLLLSLVVLNGDRRRTQARTSSPAPRAETPVRSVRPVCGIGERADAGSGTCVQEQVTPPPCVKGSRYDDDAGYCVPEPTARPTRVPSRTLAPQRVFTFPPSASPGPRTPTPPRTPEPTEAPRATPAGSPSQD